MIYSSNHLEYLCQTLAGNVGQKNGNLFGREVIITQSTGMTAWLKTELASRNGIIANIGFMNQDELLNEIYLLLFGIKSKNNKDLLRYKVYKLLEDDDFKSEFPEVAGYYNGSDLRRIQLAGRIADLFDQYQLYRSDMIELWESGQLTPAHPAAEMWQKWLWEKMKIESRKKTRDKLIDLLKANEALIRKTYPRISLFGITIFTEFHLVFFKELSKYAKVDFYLCLPTSQKEFKNELLVSFGSKALELSEMVEKNLGKFDYEKKKNDGETSLARIQDDVLNNTIDLKFTDDGSVQINSCFTPVREAECLYNYLLDLFDRDRTLKPGDILVMATDINKYSPFIKAVFRNAPVKIPFRVSGAANNSEDSMVSAIEQILRFTEDDLTSEKVVSLLEQKRIKQQFRVSDCDYIRSVVRKANIRFGRENRAEDDTRYVSWKYGLEKILLGYAMLTDEEYPVGDGLTLFPYRDAEGSDSYDLLKLKAFVERLELLIDEEGKTRTMAEWKMFLVEEVVGEMVYHDDFDKDDRAELTSVYRALSFIDSLEFEEKVPFAVFLGELDSKLFTESGEMKLNTGNVTVSAPVPVRGITFKVICFLGLDNDAFPRKDQFPGFDLLGEKYLKGDRNKKETDKYLFLDTILSARDKLYLSYTGQNVKDNTVIPPSIAVDTFIEYAGSKTILRKHPLHGFSSQYNIEAAGQIFTYLYGANASVFDPKKPDPKEFDEIPVYSFVKFFEHPAEWYFKNILGIDHDEDEQTLPETELFGLGHLEKWQMKKDLLNTEDDKLDSYFEKCVKEGKLPLKNLGRLFSEEIVTEISLLKSKYLSLTKDKTERNVVIDLNIENVRFTGTIEGVFGNEFITYAFSERLVYQVRAYLRTLLLSAQGEIKSSTMIEKKGEIKAMPVMTPDDARTEIGKLLFYFLKGSQAPLKFTMNSTKPPKKEEINIETILRSIESDVTGNKNIKPPIEPDKYLRTLYEEGYYKDFNDNDFEEFKAIASLLRLNEEQNEEAE